MVDRILSSEKLFKRESLPLADRQPTDNTITIGANQSRGRGGLNPQSIDRNSITNEIVIFQMKYCFE